MDALWADTLCLEELQILANPKIFAVLLLLVFVGWKEWKQGVPESLTGILRLRGSR